jgi:hypothetical protein
MNIININGKTYEVAGRDIVVSNNSVIVNGRTIESGLSGIVKIEFTGDVANLDCANAVVNGNVQGNVDGSNITVNGNVQGDVDGTNVQCGDVGGDVDGTSVKCGNVQGDVDAITLKKKN